ncbi:MAG: family 43 glycosylhydrolase [Clostridia bacterium]|nr:family 43 glycosylhydrolase [Clostridia bacterium]
MENRFFSPSASSTKADADIGENVVFLADGAVGNGKSASFPASSLHAAYAALGTRGGVIVICAPFTLTDVFYGMEHEGKITFTSLYNGVDHQKENGAKMVFAADFFCGGETEFQDITLEAGAPCGIFANCRALRLGKDLTCLPHADTGTYLSVTGGGCGAPAPGAAILLTIDSGVWQRIIGGHTADGAEKLTVRLTINGGKFKEAITLGSAAAFTGTIRAEIGGGVFCGGVVAANLSGADDAFDGKVDLIIRGGRFYRTVALTNSLIGKWRGAYALTLRGGDFTYTDEIRGGAVGVQSLLSVGKNVDLHAKIKGKQSFTSLVRAHSADPWIFFHDGYYYYTATAGGQGLRLIKTANLGGIYGAASAQIYKPGKGRAYSSHIWSPEIHYFSAEEVGEKYAGWYCFIASAPDEQWRTENHREDKNSTFGPLRGYVIKCLTDDLCGPWGNPVTGEVNIPQKLEFPDSGDNVTRGVMGCSVITIGGVKYLMFVSSVGRETQKTDNFNFYQTINIVKFTNPWTIEGYPKVICKPEYDWEKRGSEDRFHPAVVEGATAVYNPNGEIYIIYSASGYWTAHYQLGQLTYIGGAEGDPTDIRAWKKKPTSIFSQSDDLRGCGHASYVTDTDGQGWICYHAYPKGDRRRSAYLEPYTFSGDGLIIGNGSGHPTPPDTLYTVNVNPLPLGKRIRGFDAVKAALPEE